MKRLFKSLLSLCLCFACSAGTFITALAEEPVVEIEPVGREMLQRYKSINYTDASTNKSICVTVYYTTRYEANNATGVYITGVTSISATNKFNHWTSLSGVKMTGVSYSDNHQICTVSFSYYSEGYHVSAAKRYGSVTFQG